MRPRGGSGFALAPQARGRGGGEGRPRTSSTRTRGRRRKDALAPQNEVAQNRLLLRCEATAEPRRRGGFAIVPKRERVASASASRVRACEVRTLTLPALTRRVPPSPAAAGEGLICLPLP